MKKILLWLGIIFATIAIGALLIISVYAIDTNSITNNLDESSDVLSKESAYLQVDDDTTSKLDNFTDSVMLLTAGYRGNESTYDKAMNNYRIEGDPFPTIVNKVYKNEDATKTNYFRYWHGYVVFLRPLLTFMNYGQIRILNTILQIGLLITLLVIMYKKRLKAYIIPFISIYHILNPEAMAMSLQFSTVWYIILISSIVYLIFKEKIIEHKLHYILFTVVGMITSYMDFLTYPIATLGILLVFVLLAENLDFKQAIKRILICGSFWTLGYGIMWGAKWILVSLLDGSEARKDIFNEIIYMSNSKINEAVTISRFEAVQRAFSVYGTSSVVVVMILNFFIMISNVCMKFGNYKKDLLKKEAINSLPVFGISLVSFVWFLVLANHTYIHASFLTFRTAIVVFFACLCGLYKIIFSSAKKTYRH